MLGRAAAPLEVRECWRGGPRGAGPGETRGRPPCPPLPSAELAEGELAGAMLKKNAPGAPKREVHPQ